MSLEQNLALLEAGADASDAMIREALEEQGYRVTDTQRD